MTPEVLKPNLDLLRQEFVLVQAWKKASNYILITTQAKRNLSSRSGIGGVLSAT